MGCALTKFHSRIVDLSKRNQATNAQGITLNGYSLHTFLSNDNPNPKCIFIFGGSGSHKGEFIWEMLSQSSENYTEEAKNNAVKRLLKLSSLRLNVTKYAYHYIDVEKLIIENLDKRIRKLSTNMQMNTIGQFADIYERSHSVASNNHNNDNNHHRHHQTTTIAFDSPEPPFSRKSPTKSRRRSSSAEELKTQLLLYANIVTNSWILMLIKKEIEENNFGPFEKIFIINLIPNRISLFKNCLYLKQSPSFLNFAFNYVAINLVKHNVRKKDFDVKSDEQFDEITSNFINYFRLINKLVDIRVDSPRAKLKLKLTTSRNAIVITNLDELYAFLYLPKRAGLELNIFRFRFEPYTEPMAAFKGRPSRALLFVLNNEIELDDSLVLVLEEKNIDVHHVRKFIELYRIVQYSMNFVIDKMTSGEVAAEELTPTTMSSVPGGGETEGQPVANNTEAGVVLELT